MTIRPGRQARERITDILEAIAQTQRAKKQLLRAEHDDPDATQVAFDAVLYNLIVAGEAMNALPTAAGCVAVRHAAMAPSDIQPYQTGVALTNSAPARAPYSTRIWGCPRTFGGSVCLRLAYGKPRGPTTKIAD